MSALFFALVAYLASRHAAPDEVVPSVVEEFPPKDLIADPGPPVRLTKTFNGTELPLCGTESISPAPIESYLWSINGRALPPISIASVTNDFMHAGFHDVSLQITHPGFIPSDPAKTTYHIISDEEIEEFLRDYEGPGHLAKLREQAETDRVLWAQSFKTIGQMMELYEGRSDIDRLRTVAELPLPHGTEGDLLLRRDPDPNKTVVILANGEAATWFDIFSVNGDGSLTLREEYSFGLKQYALSIAEAPHDRVVIAGRFGVDVIDVSDIDQPRYLGRWNSPKGTREKTEHLVFAVDVIESRGRSYAFVTVRRFDLDDNDPLPYNDDNKDPAYNVTGVHVLDISEPSHIAHVHGQAYADVPGTETYLYLAGARYAGKDIVVDEVANEVLVANGDSGVHVFRYDPLTLHLSETEQWGYDLGENHDPRHNTVRHHASELHVKGDYVFVAAGKRGLVSLERQRNPNRLIKLDDLDGQGLQGLSLDTIEGKETLLLGILHTCEADSRTDCSYPDQGGLRAVHISNPRNLLLDSSIEIDFPLVSRASGSVSVLHNGTESTNRVYVESDWHAGFLYDINLDNPPEEISRSEMIPVSGEVQSLYVSGNHAYVGDSSFVVSVDISSPTSPAIVDFSHTGHGQYFGRLDGWGTNLYLHQKSRISVSDISRDDGILKLEELRLVDQQGLPLPPPYEVFCVDDGLFWVFTRSPRALTAFNLDGAPRDTPTYLASESVPEDYDFGTLYNHVACEAGRFYMLTNKAQGRPDKSYGLLIGELQEPDMKVHFTSGDELRLLQDQRVSLAVDGNTLYTNSGLLMNIPQKGCERRRSRGLIVIDVTDAAHPFVRRRLDSHLWSNTGLYLDRDGDLLYAQSYSGYESGVKVFDVSDSNSPRILAAEDINILNVVNTDYNSQGWLPGMKQGQFFYSPKLARLEVFDLSSGCPRCPYQYCRDGLMCTRSADCSSGCCEYTCSSNVNCSATDPVPGNACNAESD